jgi:hypothetical protein
MGLPDDLLVASPQVRSAIEHQFPTSGGGDAPHGVAPAASALRDEVSGASSAPRRRGQDLLDRDVDEAAGIFAMWPGV